MESLQNELRTKQQILITKLRIPTLAGGIVERPRLYELLDQGLDQALTMLAAPPGFGKTTLVADWLRRTHADVPYAWLSLTQHDNQLHAFWSYIFAAVDTTMSDGTEQFAELLDTARRCGLEAALIQWLNALHERSAPLIVVIDNYQYITSPEVHDSLAFVVEHLPQQLHVILLTSHEPPLPLSRWRARGLVNAIYADQLRYTAHEARAFFESTDLRTRHDEIASVVQQAEGWFAGLRLMSAAWKHANDTPHVLAETCGSYVYEYVRSEILAEQPAEIRAFLLHTCVVDEMCPELCNAMLQTGESAGATPSRQMLRKLEQLKLFVIPLDGQQRWYRYHLLFREALRYLLRLEEPDLAGVLLQRASAWYLSHDQLDMAIEYALRGQTWELAANLIEQWRHEAAQQRQSGNMHRADAWLARLPEGFVQARQPMSARQSARQQVVFAQPHETLLEWEVGALAPSDYARPTPTQQLSRHRLDIQELSPREREVLALIAEGASNYEIADTLVLSLHTVKRHTSNILAKLNAANRTQAVAYARAYGVLSTARDFSRHVHG